MKNLYHRLLLLIAGAPYQELALHVRYLEVENQILRSKLPKRVPITVKERNRLVKFGAKLGNALGELATIVHPDTLRRWIRESTKANRMRPVSKGRPRTKEQVRELILRLAREDNEPLSRAPSKLKTRKKSGTPSDVVPLGNFQCRQRLGGLLKHYSRKAARWRFQLT